MVSVSKSRHNGSKRLVSTTCYCHSNPYQILVVEAEVQNFFNHFNEASIINSTLFFQNGSVKSWPLDQGRLVTLHLWEHHQLWCVQHHSLLFGSWNLSFPPEDCLSPILEFGVEHIIKEPHLSSHTTGLRMCICLLGLPRQSTKDWVA